MTDARLVHQARILNYPRSIPAQLTGVWRQRLQMFIQVSLDNGGNTFKFVIPPILRHANAYSGEYRFQVLVPRTFVLNQDNLGRYVGALGSFLDTIKMYVMSVELLATFNHVQLAIEDGDMGFTTGTFKLRDWDSERIIAKIEGAIQSARVIYLNRTFFVLRFFRRTGGNGYLHSQVSLDTWLKKKRAVVYVDAPKEDCFFQCLAIHFGLPELRRKRSQTQREEQGERYRCHVGMHEQGQAVSLDCIEPYELALQVNIYVIDGRSLKLMYTSKEKFDNKMFILWQGYGDRGHFHYLSEPHVSSLWNKRKWCYECNTAYQDVRHGCVKKCAGCGCTDCTGSGKGFETFTKYCNTCNRKFYDDMCYHRHWPTCLSCFRCTTCHEVYDRKNDKHSCFVYPCTNCKKKIPKESNHECYVQTVKQKQGAKSELAFYDYECYFRGFEHMVFLVVLSLHGEIHVFKDHDAFIDKILSCKDVTFIGHYASRYDVHFIKRAFLQRGHPKTKDITNANAIFSMEIPDLNLRFIDSCRFIPFPLRDFPAIFNLQEVSKGYFPYRFFTEATKNYIGPMPELHWFSFEKLKEKEYQKALQWYEEHKHDTVNLAAWCEEYCIDDVKVLEQGCEVFRTVMMDANQQNFDPFTRLTIASVCLKTYRTLFMPEQQIALLPTEYGEHAKKNHWAQRGIRGQLGGRDIIRIGPMIEYFSICLDDGCAKCYSPYSKHPRKFMLMLQLRRWFEEWKRQCGPDNVIRECEYHETLVSDGLKIRDAFFGGRTEAIKLFCRSEHPIRYVDFTSLYPTVLLDSRMPIGYPVLIQKNFGPLQNYFGFIKCRVRPPNLYLPLLPRRRPEDDKLLFDCTESVGTWTSIEILKAIELGYEILEVYSVLHFEETSCELFRGYILHFFRMKIEATGWKKLGCPTPELQQAFLTKLQQRYDMTGVNIGEDCNKGWYHVAKLMLNSLWGKFGQRDQFTECADVFSEKEFFEIFGDDRFDIKSVFMHDAVARTICYQRKKDFQEPMNTNLAIAAFTTAHARLRLYDILEKLQERVLYMDTDSVIFIDDGIGKTLPMGNLLGEMTDELDKDDYIVEFVAAGPKAYGYVTAKGKQECKVKGFRLCHDNPINYDVMNEMVHGSENKIEVQPLQFLIGKDHKICTKDWGEQGKRFKVTHDKRPISRNDEQCIDTLPYH